MSKASGKKSASRPTTAQAGSAAEEQRPDDRLGPVAAVRIFTRSFEEALPFYRDILGFEAKVEDDGVAVFATGSCDLILEQLEPGDLEGNALAGRFVGVSFLVADAFEARDRLQRRGVRFEGPPAQQDWGGITAHFFDPDGNILTLVAYP